MDFKCITFSDNLPERILPRHIARLFSAKRFETLALAGFDQNALQCFAVFSRARPAGDVYLEYLYTLPEARGKKRSALLLSHSAAFLANLGFERMLAKKYVNPQDALSYQKFLKSLRFNPLNLGERLMVYRLEDTEMAEVRPVILRNMENLPSVSAFREVGEKRFRSLMAKIGRADVSGMSSYFPYSFFHMKNEEISGAMLAQNPSPGHIHIPVTYMGDSADRNVFLVLLTEVLTTAEQLIGNDYSFIINVDKPFILSGLMEVFNPPDFEYFLMEHTLPLAGGGISEKGRLFPECEQTISEADFGADLSKAMDDRLYAALYREHGDEAAPAKDISDQLSPAENHALSETGFNSAKTPEAMAAMENRLPKLYSRFAEQEETYSSAKRAKEYLLQFFELKEKLKNDPSIDENEADRRLRSFALDIADDVKLYKKLYVDKLGGKRRKGRILEYLKRYDRIIGKE